MPGKKDILSWESEQDTEERVIEVDTLPEDMETGAVYRILQSNPNSYTHGMFKYPCKFIPEIPRWAIQTYGKHLSDQWEPERGASVARILDPFAGSGTTLLEANLAGWNAVGTEIDDIAKLIIRVKTTQLSDAQRKMLDREYDSMNAYMAARGAKGYRPKIDNLSHWFPRQTITRLGRMKTYIDGIEDEAVRDFFRLCMASIVKRVSNADDTSPKPYVSRKVIKIPPAVEKEMASVFARYRQMEEQLAQVSPFGRSEILPGDALEFTTPGTIDLAVTSPPYINAFDYGRTMRLENLWLGTLTEEGLREKKKDYVGTEKIQTQREKERLDVLERSPLLASYYERILPADERRALIVKKFFEDMETNLRRVYDQMRPGGRYVIVIGNSTIRKVCVESWKVIEELGNAMGFDTVQHFSYVIQNPYIRIPRQGMGGKISRDEVLVLGKGE